MLISIILPNNSTFTLKCKVTHTIQHLKSKLIKKHADLFTNPQFIHCGKLLNGFYTLESYSISRGSELYLVNFDKDIFQVFIKSLSGRFYTIDIKSSFTIQDLKQKIYDTTGTHLYYQKLLYNSQVLENGNLVSDYAIKEKTIIHLMTCYSEEIEILVKGSGREIKLTVTKNFMVEWVKREIFNKTEVEEKRQVLVFKGKKLSDGKNLAYYDIHENSELGFSIENDSQIRIQIEERIITLDVQLSIKVSDLRTLISTKHSFPISNLFHSSQPLTKDSTSLSEYGIHQYSLIHVHPPVPEVHLNKDNSDSFINDPHLLTN